MAQPYAFVQGNSYRVGAVVPSLISNSTVVNAINAKGGFSNVVSRNRQDTDDDPSLPLASGKKPEWDTLISFDRTGPSAEFDIPLDRIAFVDDITLGGPVAMADSPLIAQDKADILAAQAAYKVASDTLTAWDANPSSGIPGLPIGAFEIQQRHTELAQQQSDAFQSFNQAVQKLAADQAAQVGPQVTPGGAPQGFPSPSRPASQNPFQRAPKPTQGSTGIIALLALLALAALVLSKRGK